MTDRGRDDHRLLGRLEAQVAALADRQAEIRAELAAMRICIERISTTLSEARGGWRVMMSIGGGGGVIGAGLTWLATWLHLLPPGK